MHEKLVNWIEAPTHHLTPAGRVNRPLISNVCEWVKNSRQWVTSETIVKTLLYEESDASSERNYEDDFSGSDDDFLGFYYD